MYATRRNPNKMQSEHGQSLKTYIFTRIIIKNTKKKRGGGGDAAEKCIDARSNTATVTTGMIKYKNVSTRKSYFISKKQRREERSALG